MKQITLLSLLSLLCALLLGCGGGSNSSSPSGQAITTGTGRAVFKVVWPQRSRLVPEAANSIKVDILNASLPVTSKVLARPTSGNQTTTPFDALPPGNLTVIVTAYPQADGSGVAQAQASAPLAIQVNKTSTLNLTMASTIDHLEVIPDSLSLPPGQTYQLIVTAYDVSHQVVLTAADKMTWKSDTANVATVSSSGLVQAGVVGSAQITITETESGKTVKLPVTVATSGSGGGGGGSVQPWAQYGHDAQHTFGGSGQGAIGKLKWTADLQQLLYIASMPVLNKDGLLFVPLISGSPIKNYMAAVSSQTGKIQWKKLLPDATMGINNGLVLGTNGLVYASQSTILYAWTQATGTESWTHDFSTETPVGMTIGPDNTLYVSAGSHIYALDGTTGTTKWTSPAINYGLGNSTLGTDGTVYVGSTNATFSALDGTNGKLKWTFSAPASPDTNNLVTMPSIGPNGTLYFCGPGNVYALKDNGTGFTIKWSFQLPSQSGSALLAGSGSAPAIGPDGTVYFTASDLNLYALDGTTGAQKWKVKLDINLSEASIDSSGTLYMTYSMTATSPPYSLVALDGQSGNTLWTYPLGTIGARGHAPPTIGPDGVLYMSDGNVGLIAVR